MAMTEPSDNIQVLVRQRPATEGEMSSGGIFRKAFEMDVDASTVNFEAKKMFTFDHCVPEEGTQVRRCAARPNPPPSPCHARARNAECETRRSPAEVSF